VIADLEREQSREAPSKGNGRRPGAAKRIVRSRVPRPAARVSARPQA